MVVQHNMQAMNANRMLNITTNAQSKSSEKLSSGYRINRAADDAAGLSISEKMRKQIRGLDQASTNAEDGVSAVQTAEGALTEVHDMLQRMNALAVQAANGTNSESDRQSIQDEIDQLTTEIDRVAETTKFNETYLLQGNGTKTNKTINAHDAGLDGTLVDNGDGTSTFTLDEELEIGDSVTIGGVEYTIKGNGDETDYVSTNDYVAADGDKVTTSDASETYVYIDSGENGYTNDDGKTITATTSGWYALSELNGYGEDTELDGSTAVSASSVVADGNTLTDEAGSYEEATFYTYDEDAKTIDDAYELMKTELIKASSIGTDTAATAVNNKDGSFTITQGSVEVSKGLSFSLHVGADADMTNKIIVDIDSMSSAGIGVKGLTVAGDDVTNATYAIDAISDAIAKVSEQRSALGAVQNRLEHTISNLDNVVENTTSAESRIRDTDMAEEMVEYSKNNILAQAGQSMLAQANTATQGVLSLLG